MKGPKGDLAVPVLFALVLTFMLSDISPASSETAPATHTILIGKSEAAGSFLTDAHGMTLYYFRKDTQGNSVCIGDCLGQWPAFYAETISAPPGVDPDEFSFITRKDGKRQTTFKGFPLYYFSGDKQPGDTLGQGMNNLWFIVTPDKFRN